jgi:hypothetical protein
MNSNVFPRIGTEKKTIKFLTPLLEQESTFPHAYFTKKPGKPTVIGAANSEEFKNAAINAVQKWLVGNDAPEVSMTVAFLYVCSKDFPKKELKDDWTSYDLKIGVKWDKIGPMDLLTNDKGSGLSGEHKVDQDFSWQEPFCRLLMAYSMKKVRESPDTNYVSGMITKLSALG